MAPPAALAHGLRRLPNFTLRLYGCELAKFLFYISEFDLSRIKQIFFELLVIFYTTTQVLKFVENAGFLFKLHEQSSWLLRSHHQWPETFLLYLEVKKKIR